MVWEVILSIENKLRNKEKKQQQSCKRDSVSNPDNSGLVFVIYLDHVSPHDSSGRPLTVTVHGKTRDRYLGGQPYPAIAEP